MRRRFSATEIRRKERKRNRSHFVAPAMPTIKLSPEVVDIRGFLIGGVRKVEDDCRAKNCLKDFDNVERVVDSRFHVIHDI